MYTLRLPSRLTGYLLLAAGAVSIAWLAVAVLGRDRLGVGVPGGPSLAGALLPVFFGWPDFYGPLIKLWARELPLLTASVGSVPWIAPLPMCAVLLKVRVAWCLRQTATSTLRNNKMSGAACTRSTITCAGRTLIGMRAEARGDRCVRICRKSTVAAWRIWQCTSTQPRAF